MYGSYSKIKTGVSLVWTTLYMYVFSYFMCDCVWQLLMMMMMMFYFIA